jgi:hypothetical protein
MITKWLQSLSVLPTGGFTGVPSLPKNIKARLAVGHFIGFAVFLQHCF